VADDGERIATLEEAVRGLREDVQTLSAQIDRSRTRLHNLEGFAQAYLDTQKVNRRQEDNQYRRMGNRIALGGLVMAAAMVMLTVVTLLSHT
jgi:hypothetical protein